MVRNDPKHRRAVLKQFGAGITGIATVGGMSGVASADHVISNFPYEDDIERTKLTDAHGRPLKQTANHTLRIDQAETETGDHRIWVEISGAAGTAWTDTDERAYDILDHKIAVEYPEDESTDYYWRRDDDWIGAWDIDHVSDDDLDWVSNTAKNTASLAIDLLDSTVGTAFDIAIAVGEFLQGYSEHQSETDTKREVWDYVDTGDQYPYGAEQVAGFRRFELRLDPGEITEFTVGTECTSHYTLGFGTRKSYTIQAPSW